MTTQTSDLSLNGKDNATEKNNKNKKGIDPKVAANVTTGVLGIGGGIAIAKIIDNVDADEPIAEEEPQPVTHIQQVEQVEYVDEHYEPEVNVNPEEVMLENDDIEEVMLVEESEDVVEIEEEPIASIEHGPFTNSHELEVTQEEIVEEIGIDNIVGEEDLVAQIVGEEDIVTIEEDIDPTICGLPAPSSEDYLTDGLAYGDDLLAEPGLDDITLV